MMTTTVNKSDAAFKKANKPLMEKRRRARINESLAQLKKLILDPSQEQNSKHSKLEKADILELAVRYVENNMGAINGAAQYRAGYTACIREVERLLDMEATITKSEKVLLSVKPRLLRHLTINVEDIIYNHHSQINGDVNNNAASTTTTTATFAAATATSATATATSAKASAKPATASATFATATAKPATATATFATATANPATAADNKAKLAVLHVVPTRLPDGKVEFVLPTPATVKMDQFPYSPDQAKGNLRRQRRSYTQRTFRGQQRPNTQQPRNVQLMVNAQHEPLDCSVKPPSSDPIWRPWGNPN